MAIKDIMKESMQNFANEAVTRFPKLADFNTLSGKVTTLIGSDVSKSVRTIANEELAAQLIPASAQEALDTLQEIAAWIQAHPAEAAAINAKLTLGTYEDETTHEQVQYNTVKAYVEAYVASQIGDAALSPGNGISIINGIVSAVIDTANANGLDLTANGLKMGLASASTNGALSSTDWNTFNAKQEQMVIPAATGEGNAITGATLDADGKTINFVKGETFVKTSDIVALTSAECTAIFNEAFNPTQTSGD